MINILTIELMIIIIRAESKAAQKFAISKPLITALTSHSINPLITRVNKPKVTKLMGKVSKMRTGRIVALIKPSKIKPNIAARNVTSNPFTRYAVKILPRNI